MIKFVRILFAVICLFILQNVFEAIIMGVMAKLGITYMDVEVRGEGFIEIIEGISVYFLYSKLLYVAPAYFVLMIACILYFFHHKEIRFKDIAVVHIAVSLLIFLVLWFVFGNGFKFIANPLLGLLIAGLLIYLLTTKVRNPLVRLEVKTV